MYDMVLYGDGDLKLILNWVYGVLGGVGRFEGQIYGFDFDLRLVGEHGESL